MNIRSDGLWRNPDFMRLWIGQTVSRFGSRISRDDIPLIVVIVLSVTPAQPGMLLVLLGQMASVVGCGLKPKNQPAEFLPRWATQAKTR